MANMKMTNWSYIKPEEKELAKQLMKDSWTFKQLEGITVPYIVMAPNPYVINLGHNTDETTKKEKIAGVEKKLKEFKQLLTDLKISDAEAIEKDYSMNLTTKDKLSMRPDLSLKNRRKVFAVECFGQASTPKITII